MRKIQVGGGETDKTVYVGINAKRQTCKTFKSLKITDVLLQTCAHINGQLSPNDPKVWETAIPFWKKAKPKQTNPSLSLCFHKFCAIASTLTVKEHNAEKLVILGMSVLHDNDLFS